jgi:GNAT superfamily N-acetyltransferase
VAALRGGELAGFLAAWVLPEFKGRRTVYSPEWGNAARHGESRRVYEAMYAHLSARWVADGCGTHLIGALAHDRAAIEGWHWLGFGMIAADAVRGLDAVPGPVADVVLRRGRVEDAHTARALDEALRRHLASAPTFLFDEEEGEDGDAVAAGWLRDPANALWLAYRDTEVVAGMKIGPANPNACTLIRDEGTASIVGAFTVPEARGGGIAAALLNRSLAWARDEGYVRCAVDFEPMNVLAAHFWTRYFQPICYALIRHVDERVVGGTEDS